MLLDLLKDIQSNLGDPCYLGRPSSKDAPDAPNGICISLLSINEHAGIQRPVFRVTDEYKHPPEPEVHSLELHILITALNRDYEAALRDLDRVRHYFSGNSYHSLSTQDINYTIQLANLTIEQHIILGQSFLSTGPPGIIYKVSTVTRSE